MSEIVTTGTWFVEDSNVPAFVEAWVAFTAWASTQAGAGSLQLGRDTADRRRFVSYGTWESTDAARQWKKNPETQSRKAQVVRYAEDYQPGELEIVACADDGKVTVAVAH